MPIKNNKIIYWSLFLLLGALLLPTVVFAAGEVPTLGGLSSVLGTATLAQIIIRMIQFFLATLSVIVVGLLLYAGFNWMTSQGDPTKIEKAKQTIYQAIIGLIIIFSAFAITAFIFDRFGPSTDQVEPCLGPACPTPPTCIGPSCEIIDPYNLLPPEITYIDPAFDVNGDTIRTKITTSTVDDDISNGAKGNLITVYGRYFGSQIGKVYFVDRATNARIEADVAPCEKSWTSNQIIVLVPTAGITANGVTVDAGVSSNNPIFNYEVIVVKNPTSTSPLESLPRGFQVNQIERPGICSMVPKNGVYPATTTISGLKFPTSGTQNVIWEINPYTVTSTGNPWTDISTVSVIPDGVKGKALVSIFNGTVSSNFYAFMISDGKLNSPCGFDTISCREDSNTCALSGLICAENCTCQKPPSTDSCTYNSNTSLNTTSTCDLGGCFGIKTCTANGIFGFCILPASSTCIPYLGAKSSIASFSWSFNAFKKPAPGMSCVSDVWRDGTCDINGCIDPALSCDPLSSKEEWVEIYNPTNQDINLNTKYYTNISNWIRYSIRYSGSGVVNQQSFYTFPITAVIKSHGYYRVPGTQPVSQLVLPKSVGQIYLVIEKNVEGVYSIKDDVGYGGNNEVAPAFSPASFGRSIDGLDTNSSTDFIYFSQSTNNKSNNPSKTPVTGNELVINEVSIGHEACTCVQKTSLCKKNNKEACPDVGQCKMIKSCSDSGRWGECTQVNSSCIPYPLVPPSTIASYSWSFGANSGDNGNGPMVVSACDGSIDCSKNRLPSPSPFSLWTSGNNSGVTNELACLNATIYARFNKAMAENTLTQENIKLYKPGTVTGGTGSIKITMNAWTEVSKADYSIVPLQSGKIGIDSFIIRLNNNLESDKDYRVYLSKDIRDQLGRQLIDNPAVNGVKQLFCSDGSSLGLPLSNGVCWSFRTRPSYDPKKICDVGCVNCGPDGYFNRYYGDKQKHNAYPISLDNSCIMLNPNNYAWDWSVEKQTNQNKDDRQWSIMRVISEAYSWLLDLSGLKITEGIDPNSVLHQLKNTPVTGMATTTAQIESKWRTNADYSSWFGDDDFDFFAVRTKEVASQNSGICRVHNDFTDPIVIESQYCSKSDDPTKRILQSPSPWKGQTDACINASIFVLFSRNMWNGSLINPTDQTVKNFNIYKCSTSSAATSTNFTANSACVLQTGWTAKMFNHTNQGLSMQELVDATTLGVNSNLIRPEGVQVIPPSSVNSGKLEKNSWYRIVINGGSSGVRGGTSTPEQAEGVLQVPNPNARLTNTASGEDSYYWYFKTGSEDCPIDQIAVLPQVAYMPTIGERQDYLADPYAANCNHLNPYLYVWKWDSLINPFILDGRCNASQINSGNGVATICSQSATSCAISAPTSNSPTTPEAKAFSQGNGNTFITAAAQQETCATNKWGAGELQVGDGAFRVSQHRNTDCLNPEVKIDFSRDATSSSMLIADNLSLYACNDTTCATADPTKKIAIEISSPQGSVASPNPIFTNRAYFSPKSVLTAGQTYRVVVKGGTAGVISVQKANLKDLNFKLNNNNGGEACDPTVYPWRTGDPEAGLCSAGNCTFNPSKNLCGKTSQECDIKISTSTISNPTAYCNNNCQSKGNTNVASCGNGVVELGEDCDDSNIVSGDGCRARCLLEGSSVKYGSTCGNGRVEKGEQCDDGNNSTGDGCSSCLYESDYGTNAASLYKNFACGSLNKATTTVTISGQSVLVKSACQTPGSNGCNANCLNAGSEPKAPICGNGKIEFGEECDDAVNNGSGKRCLANCLLSGAGTSATCNNDKLDNGAFDSYSWTFKLPSDAGICQDIVIGLNPCPNGVWSMTADSAIDNFTTKIYKGMNSDSGGCIKDADMNKMSFWRRIFNQIVSIIKSFLGFNSVIAADWWCPVTTQVFSNDDLKTMRLGNFTRNATINTSNDTELLGYTNDSNNYKVNFIKSTNWASSTQFKMVVSYEKNGIKSTSTGSIATYGELCKIEDVKYDVWPRGLTKKSDSFFCASDPTTGKADDCGRFSETVYDDDMSTGWTMNQPSNGYNLTATGTAQTATNLDNYLPGNNHLYRVWPLGDKTGGSNKFVIRGNSFVTDLININTKTTSSPLVSTNYNGDFWMTSGFNPGRSYFNVTIQDTTAGDVGSHQGTLPIYTFFCNNPWPDAGNFPFVDSSSNCKSGDATSTCLNTNFATFYCRDAGVEKTCVKGDANRIGASCTGNSSCWAKASDSVANPLSCQSYVNDDLPSIANYDAFTGKFGDGTAVIKGNVSEPCTAAPGVNCDKKLKEFLFAGIPDEGGASSAVSGDKLNAAVVLKGSNGTISGGTPVTFETRFNATEGSAMISQGHASGEGDVLYNLPALTAGNYYLTLETSNNEKYTTLPAGFNGEYGSCKQDTHLSGNQLYQKIDILVDGAIGSTVWALASQPDNHQFNRLAVPLNLTTGTHTIALRFINDCFCNPATNSCPSGHIDSNLKIYSIFLNRNTTAGIGMRVYNNNNHFSPTLWYVNRFYPNLGDNLTKLTVDGYGAAQEGRTTYINAADYTNIDSTKNPSQNVYTNMYLWSYSQGAGKTTQEIYAQLLANTFFNAGLADEGGLEYSTALQHCSEGEANEDNVCFSDMDCVKRNAGYCKSIKGKITRDTQRLSDLQTIYTSMAVYHNKLRCSNDFARSCKTNVDCYGGGSCGNFYPNLRAGTYITGKTFSVWPSWQDNLAKELGFALPVDPINKLWKWDGSKSVKCADPFDAVTCWNQTSKIMECNLDYNSAVYAYYGTKTGTSTSIYAKGEAGGNWGPDWSTIANLQYKPFDGYNSLITAKLFCESIADACGNGSADANENCSNCPLDNACTISGESCQKNATGWGCALIKNCGDGFLQPGEECDGGIGCVNCKLDNGYTARFGIVQSVCGDGVPVTGEMCEFINGVPKINNLLVTATHIGQLACTAQCQIADWYQPIYSAGTLCGDGLKTDQEACDCGTGTGALFGADIQKFNVFTCPSLNQDPPTAYSNTTLKDYPYCDKLCQRHDGQYYYCGDGHGTNSINNLLVTDWVDWYGKAGKKCAGPGDKNNADCQFTYEDLAIGAPLQTFFGEQCDYKNINCTKQGLCGDKCSLVTPSDPKIKCDPNCKAAGGGCCYVVGDKVCTPDACEKTYCAKNPDGTYNTNSASWTDCQTCNADDICCDNLYCNVISTAIRDDGAVYYDMCGGNCAVNYPGTMPGLNQSCKCANGLQPWGDGSHFHLAGTWCTCDATHVQNNRNLVECIDKCTSGPNCNPDGSCANPGAIANPANSKQCICDDAGGYVVDPFDSTKCVLKCSGGINCNVVTGQCVGINTHVDPATKQCVCDTDHVADPTVTPPLKCIDKCVTGPNCVSGICTWPQSVLVPNSNPSTCTCSANYNNIVNSNLCVHDCMNVGMIGCTHTATSHKCEWPNTHFDASTGWNCVCDAGKYDWNGQCVDYKLIPWTAGNYWNCYNRDCKCDCTSLNQICYFKPDKVNEDRSMDSINGQIQPCVNNSNDGCCAGTDDINNEYACRLTSSDYFSLKEVSTGQWIGVSSDNTLRPGISGYSFKISPNTWGGVDVSDGSSVWELDVQGNVGLNGRLSIESSNNLKVWFGGNSANTTMPLRGQLVRLYGYWDAIKGANVGWWAPLGSTIAPGNNIWLRNVDDKYYYVCTSDQTSCNYPSCTP